MVIAARKRQLEEEMQAMRDADPEEDLDDGDHRHVEEERSLGGKDEEEFLESDDEDREYEELKECTFKPNINKNNIPARSVDDLIEWGKMKHHRMLETKIQINCFDPNNFKPFVNPKSKKIAGRRKGNIEDRLLKLGEEHKETLKKKREDATKGLFKPVINEKSKELAGKKKRGEDDEYLTKTLTAQHGRADYFVTGQGKSVERLASNAGNRDSKAGSDFKVDPM